MQLREEWRLEKQKSNQICQEASSELIKNVKQVINKFAAAKQMENT